jgi:DNA-binding MarR family transcriptional regulator
LLATSIYGYSCGEQLKENPVPITRSPAPDRETSTLRPRATSSHLALLRATESFSRTLRESGASLARGVECSRSTLAIVRTLDANGPLPVSDIAQQLRVDVSVASRQLALLADEGYVERIVDTTDRRVRSIALSESGRARTREIEASLEARTREVFADWSEADIDEAVAILHRLAATIDGAGREPTRPADPG